MIYRIVISALIVALLAFGAMHASTDTSAPSTSSATPTASPKPNEPEDLKGFKIP